MGTSIQEHPFGGFSDAERRQITVVYVDMVGSSRLAAQLDPEDFGELIVRYRAAAAAAIDAHGGFVARYLGDGILAYWGYPRAHEDDPRRAVSAGLAVVAAMKAFNEARDGAAPVHVRVGIDSGIVVVGQLGQMAAGSAADIVGEAPNTAARVQSLATPDSVLITETVSRLVDGQFDLEPMPGLTPDGTGGEIQLYRVHGQRLVGRRSRPARPARIFGREFEQRMLEECWRSAASGQGQTVLLTGEAGIGKTTLADHLQRTALASGGLCLRTACAPETVHAPLLPIRDLLRQSLGLGQGDEVGTARGELSLRSRLDGDSAADLLLPLLDPTASEDALTALTASERKRLTFAAAVDRLTRMATDTPTAIVIDDLHWADTSSLELLDALMARVAVTRLCLLLTWRTGVETAWIDRADVSRLPVPRLRNQAVEALVAELLSDELDPETRQAIVAKAEGNPLFAEELVQLAGEARRRGGSAAILALPSSLNDSLVARLDGLGELKPLAQVAAVIGREFDDRVLARVLDLPPAEIETQLARLVASGLVVDWGGGLRTSHGFKHALVRDAAYNSLLKARRRVLHARTASVLVNDFPQSAEAQPELVAHHYEEAGEIASAITWWMRAGDRASRHSATTDAIRVLERGKALFARLPPGDHAVLKASLLNLLGGQYVASRGNAAAPVVESFAEAAALLEATEGDHAGPLFTALWGLHTHAMVRAELPRAIDIGMRMLALAERSDDPDRVLQAHRVQGLARLLTGAHEAAARHYAEVLARYGAERHAHHRYLYGSDPAAVVFAQRGWSEWICGHVATSERSAADGCAYARAAVHPHSLVHAVGVDAWRLLTGREYRRAAAAAEEARHEADRHGFPYWLAWCDIVAAAAERPRDPAHAAAALASAIARYRLTGARQQVPYALALQAECLVDADRPDEALPLLDEASALVEETGVRLYEAEILRLRACVRHRLGDTATADDDLAHAIDIARAQGARTFLLRSFVTGLGWRPTDENTRRSLADVLAGLHAEPDTPDLREARRLAGGGDHSSAQ